MTGREKTPREEKPDLDHEELFDKGRIVEQSIAILAARLRENRSPGEDGCGSWEECLEEAREEYERLSRRVDEILFYKWDPIRLSDSNWSRDEYERYVPPALKLALEHETPGPLGEFLTMASTELIGLSEDRERDVAVAATIHAVVTDSDYFPNHAIFEVE